MWKLTGKRSEMIGAINANATQTTVRIMAKPSRKIFFLLLQKTQVKKILLSAGIAKTVPKSVYAGLAEAGVAVEEIDAVLGRPEKFYATVRKKLLVAVRNGMPLAAALKKSGASRRSYFYWKKKMK